MSVLSRLSLCDALLDAIMAVRENPSSNMPSGQTQPYAPMYECDSAKISEHECDKFLSL